MLRIAIVGIGPWGLCALERVVTLARQELPRGIDIAVHVVEPGTPGSGVYDTTQPDYLLLNNPCGQLTLYPFETESYRRRTESACMTGRLPGAIDGSATGVR